jgi:SNF2 family DNA or RNA helicase
MAKKKLPPLHDYQMSCIEFGLQNPAAGFFLDPGLGKTRIILELFKQLRYYKVVDTLVVVAKLRICKSTWPAEITKWEVSNKITMLHGVNKESDFLLYHKPGIVIINYDGLNWFEKMYKRYKKNTDFGRMMLVLDESTQVKNTNTIRFRKLKSLCSEFDRRYILTGTPCPNTLMDLYGQIYMLDGGKTLGTKTSFKNTYFEPCGFKGYDLRPINDADKLIFNKIDDLVIRFDSDLLDLPEQIIVDRKVVLNNKTREVYNDLEKEFIHILEKNVSRWSALVVKSSAVLTNKLRQLVGGAVYKDTESKEILEFGNDKIEELISLIDELSGKPCFVAYEFNHEHDRLVKHLSTEFGKKNIRSFKLEKDTTKLINDWNSGKVRVLLGHPQSVAHGLNLQGVNACVIFFSNNYNLEHYIQFIERVARLGQEAKHVFIYRLVATNTIDSLILKALENKSSTQKKFLTLAKKHYVPAKGGYVPVAKRTLQEVN